jgi:hypothetical protein
MRPQGSPLSQLGSACISQRSVTVEQTESIQHIVLNIYAREHSLYRLNRRRLAAAVKRY